MCRFKQIIQWILGLFVGVMPMFMPQEGLAAGIGDVAPMFSLPDAAGKTVSLESLRGKRVLINFWATWCAPCKQELPELDRLYQRLSGQDIVIVAINVDETASLAKGFMTHYRLSLPILFDPKGETINRFEPSVMPTSYLLDAKGVIRFIYSGFEGETTIKQIEMDMEKLK